VTVAEGPDGLDDGPERSDDDPQRQPDPVDAAGHGPGGAGTNPPHDGGGARGESQRSGDAPGDEGPDGLQGVQQAAHQMISAARGLLDALEALVDDPAAVRDTVSVVGGLARDAARMAADAGRQAAHGTAPSGGDAGERSDADEEPPDDGPVQHIDVR
jgi:hypothetical protein